MASFTDWSYLCPALTAIGFPLVLEHITHTVIAMIMVAVLTASCHTDDDDDNSGESSGSGVAVGWIPGLWHSGADFQMPYQLFIPADSSKKAPLVIHLHGAGENGTDNIKQLYQGSNIGPDYFASDPIQKINAAFVLAPQSPIGMRWASNTVAEYDLASTPPTQSMTALRTLIEHIVAQYPMIDTHRIYLAGLSQGGQGVWDASMRTPHYFAAVAPMSGAGSPADANLLTHLPIWAFHNYIDPVTSVTASQHMVDAIIKAGGTSALVRYTELQEIGHGSWTYAYKGDGLWQWMLTHKLSDE